MNNRELDEFIGQVNQIKAMFAPGALSADGAGGRSSAQEMVYELKKETAALKEACSKDPPEKNTVEALKVDIEGILLGMNSVNALDNSTLGALLGKLHLV